MMNATFNFAKWYHEILTDEERKIADELMEKVVQFEKKRKENK